ncbi:hypothetical protein QEJ31_11920 [Pigmentibacter sp. JX0631]|uniref:hypothetical protein n=1 Tax=Pigmentibacter sp. JX0631 TaxID=2976982 RepID=UPI0024683B70|nr:hypothetical protein [Pigmentibacter sp. JX0631]WGL59229.1 hypothetical protein QEJ31_11920 [Pigmentibacter sp. JX0631]
MLANFIFHFIFAVFLVWGLLAWIILHKKLNELRTSLLPILCQKEIEFPKHRSIFRRSTLYISEELSRMTGKKIKFHYKVELLAKLPIDILYPFARLNSNAPESNEKIFFYANEYISLNDLLFKLKNLSHTKAISFILMLDTNHSFIWKVENTNV